MEDFRFGEMEDLEMEDLEMLILDLCIIGAEGSRFVYNWCGGVQICV